MSLSDADTSTSPAAVPGRTWPVLTWKLAAIAAVLSVAVGLLPISTPWALLVADGSLLVIAIVDWALTPEPNHVGVDRTLPFSLAIGQPGQVRWDLVNPVPHRLRVTLSDELAPSLLPGSRRASFVLDPSGAGTATTEIKPTRRGDFSPTELAVTTSGPLGLAGKQATRALPGQLRVLPSFRSKRQAELRIDRARILDVGVRSARFRGSGTEFEQLRDWTSDDESRRIDWAATARVARPIVRSFGAERNKVVLILLDNGRVMAGHIDDVPRVEYAMEAAMTLTSVATRLGDQVGLVAFDRHVRRVVPPAGSAGQVARIVDAMYGLEPQLAESDYRLAFLETLSRFRRRCLLVLLTELADRAMQEILLAALPVIVRHHLVVVGTVRDPQLDEWATALPTEAATSYRKAAAVASLAERRRLVGTLTAMGVGVVDAAPGRVSAQLADHYLTIKATGTL